MVFYVTMTNFAMSISSWTMWKFCCTFPGVLADNPSPFHSYQTRHLICDADPLLLVQPELLLQLLVVLLDPAQVRQGLLLVLAAPAHLPVEEAYSKQN